MYNETELDRHDAKTSEQRFLQVLEQEFRYAPKIAEAILGEAQGCLVGKPGNIKVGQMRVLIARQKAASGQALSQTSKVEVTWTMDAGAEDIMVLRKYGPTGLRQVRIQRLLDEALEQGALASQEDLAWVLHISPRTIKRDFVELQTKGLYLPSRGYMKGIGRGQTHKAQIIRRWLHGETYDQLSINSHHAVSSINRYLKTFVQVVRLHQEGMSTNQIALLLQIGEPLVRDYLDVYEHNAEDECRERLAEQLTRLCGTDKPKKGAQ
jgi:predicted ArsR family transcriptional regulator